MLTLTFISYFLYNEVTNHFEIPMCNYLINAVTVKEAKPIHLHVHNEPLILFLHGHVVITDWGCVYACVCERRGILWRTEGEGGRESKLKENFTSMATRLFRLPCLLSSSSILTEPGITSTALLSVLHRRASVRSLLLFTIQSPVVLVYVGLWMCWWVGVLLGSTAIVGAFVVHIHPWAFLGW